MLSECLQLLLISSLILSPGFIEIMLIVCAFFAIYKRAATPVYAAFSRRCFVPDCVKSLVIVRMTFNFPVPPSP